MTRPPGSRRGPCRGAPLAPPAPRRRGRGAGARALAVLLLLLVLAVGAVALAGPGPLAGTRASTPPRRWCRRQPGPPRDRPTGAREEAATPRGIPVEPPAEGGPHGFVAFQADGVTPVALRPLPADPLRPPSRGRPRRRRGGRPRGHRPDLGGDRPGVHRRRRHRRAVDARPPDLPAGPVRRPVGAGADRLGDRGAEPRPGRRHRRRGRQRRRLARPGTAGVRDRTVSLDAGRLPEILPSGTATRPRGRSSCTNWVTWSA